MAKAIKKEREIKHEDEDKFYPAEEQGILPEENSTEVEEDMESGLKDKDPLTEEGRDTLVEDDEMESWEAGFAEGASEEGQLGKDALTGEPLMGAEDVTEMEIKGKNYRFVSQANAIKFKKKKEKEAKN